MKIRHFVIPAATFAIGYFGGELSIVKYELKLLKKVLLNEDAKRLFNDCLCKDFLPANKKAFVNSIQRILFGMTAEELSDMKKRNQINRNGFSYHKYYDNKEN